VSEDAAPERIAVIWSPEARTDREIFRPEAELGKNLLHRDPLATVLRKPGLAGV
jgi:hypothetical protein